MPMIALLFLLAAVAPPAPPPEAVQDCREAAAQLASGLMSELTKAMADGGPVPALAVCKDKAPAIAAAVSKEKGVTIRRTALKVRNPENRPDPWETRILKAFESRLAAGEDPSQMEVAEVAEVGGKKVVRFMKAIPTKEFCLRCHGERATMAPEVAAEVAKLYPGDEAVGFKAGDLRGAFSVTRPLPAASGK